MFRRRRGVTEKLEETRELVEEAALDLQGRVESYIDTLPAGRTRRRGPRDWLYDGLGLLVPLANLATRLTRLVLVAGVAVVGAAVAFSGWPRSKSEEIDRERRGS